MICESSYELPKTGYVRLPTILRHIPISKSAWWKGINEDRFPKPVKLGPRTTAWRAEDIHQLIRELGNSRQTEAAAEQAR